MYKNKIETILLILLIILFDAPDYMESIVNYYNFSFKYIIAIKIILPIILLTLNYKSIQKIIKTSKKKLTYINCYLIIFLIFLIYSIIPTIINGDLFNYGKYVIRFLIAVTIFLYIEKLGFYLIIKYLTCILIYFFCMYLLAYLIIIINSSNDANSITIIEKLNETLLFGRINPTLFVNQIPFIQFRSIFGEPSNSAGVYGAFSFILIYKYTIFKKIKYLWMAVAFQFAVICSFSFAGYLAVFFSLMISWIFLVKRQTLDRVVHNWYLCSLIIFFSLSIMRPYLVITYENIKQQKWTKLEMIFGAHKILDQNKLDSRGVDISDGRLQLIEESWNYTIKNPLGIGIQNIIENPRYDINVTDISASAPFFWLLLTGYIGIGLLLTRDIVIFYRIHKINQIQSIHLFGAFLVKFISELNYGILMSPIYFLVVIILLIKKDQSSWLSIERRIQVRSATRLSD